MAIRIKQPYLLLLVSLLLWANLAVSQEIQDLPEADEADAMELNQSLQDEAIKVKEKIEVQPSTKSFEQLRSNLNYQTVAVVQKIYAPKTGRFSFYGGGGIVPNDVFYRTFTLNGKAGYFINEKWGLEAYGNLFSSAETSDVRDLQSNQGLAVNQLIYMKSSLGLQLHYSGMYGKMALLNHEVIPFDFYQVVGMGMMRTSEGRDEATLHAGFGQFFALSRSYGLRWEFDALTFKSTNPTSDQRSYTYLLFTIGMQGLAPKIGMRD